MTDEREIMKDITLWTIKLNNRIRDFEKNALENHVEIEVEETSVVGNVKPRVYLFVRCYKEVRA